MKTLKAILVLGMLLCAISSQGFTRQSRDFCAGIGPYYWEIGDKNGPLASGSVNSTSTESYDANTVVNIASASKWLYGAYVAQTKSLDASDVKYLTMTGGYDDFGSCTWRQTVAQCSSAGTNGLYDPTADGKFYYSGGQMQHLAALSPLGAYNALALSNAMSAALGISVSYGTPQLAGGASLTPAAYAAFLRELMTNQLALGPLLGTNKVCTNPRTCATALNAPIPTTESWHYSLGHWVEDDPVMGDGSFSSPGAFGFYPWISADRRYYGIVARKDDAGAWSSVQCGRQIRAAWRASHP